MFSLHRISGSIVGLFFLMWFVSGLVLIYHPFPNASKSQKYGNMDALPDSLPDVRLAAARLPESDGDIKTLNVKYFQGQVLFAAGTKNGVRIICGDAENAEPKPVTWSTVEAVARKWVAAPAARIDTLRERDIWIMYSRYVREMPVYKFYFDDREKHQLYIASASGEALQFTNRRQRLWAWAGAIPHKLYIPALRKNTETWIMTLTVGGCIALVAALSGLYVGICVVLKRCRAGKWIISPYKKKWYRWHHITGLVFGVFVAAFAFSGAMGLQRIPEWAVKTYGDYRIADSRLRGKRLSVNDYVLDYRVLKNVYPDLKSVEWSHFQNTPVYNIVAGDKSLCIDASTSEARELFLPQSEIEKAVAGIHGGDESFSVSLISEYEEYYMSRESALPLPAYRVEVNNADESRYYIDPRTGDFKYLNRSRKVRKWVFGGLHYLNIKWLVERPALWTAAIWILCLGGMVVSLSGVRLSLKYLKRKRKKL